MPNRPAKSSFKKTPLADLKVAYKSKTAVAELKRQRFDAMGSNTRVNGHMASRGRRVQAKRDAR